MVNFFSPSAVGAGQNDKLIFHPNILADERREISNHKLTRHMHSKSLFIPASKPTFFPGSWHGDNGKSRHESHLSMNKVSMAFKSDDAQG